MRDVSYFDQKYCKELRGRPPIGLHMGNANCSVQLRPHSHPHTQAVSNKHLGATVIAPRGLRSSNDREDQLMTLIQISVYASAFVKQYFRNQ